MRVLACKRCGRRMRFIEDDGYHLWYECDKGHKPSTPTKAKLPHRNLWTEQMEKVIDKKHGDPIQSAIGADDW